MMGKGEITVKIVRTLTRQQMFDIHIHDSFMFHIDVLDKRRALSHPHHDGYATEVSKGRASFGK